MFEQRPLRLFAINGGYHTVQYTLIGLSSTPLVRSWRTGVTSGR